MENKTALQQAFSDLEKMQPHLFNTFSQGGRDFVYHFHKYLEIEKQQIMNAYVEGLADGFDEGYHNDKAKYEDSLEYYKKTFKNEPA